MEAPVTTDNFSLVDKILALHGRFDAARIRHAFGGALALAYYTADPRTTAYIDVNVSVPAERAHAVLRALPAEVTWDQQTLARIEEDEQARVWWGRTPVDLSFRASAFHDGVDQRTVWHKFGATHLPFLSANDLVVFKSLFDRPKDWLDIAAMVHRGTVDVVWAANVLRSLLGADDRIDRLEALAAEAQ